MVLAPKGLLDTMDLFGASRLSRPVVAVAALLEFSAVITLSNEGCSPCHPSSHNTRSSTHSFTNPVIRNFGFLRQEKRLNIFTSKILAAANGTQKDYI